MAMINLCSPWVEYYRKVNALFEDDSAICVILDEENMALKIYPETEKKYAALDLLLPKKKEFGNVILNIEIVPRNEGDQLTEDQENLRNAVLDLFDDNDSVSYIHIGEGIFKEDIIYVVFHNQVVQYFSDDLCDINGLHSTLYQDIAREILKPVTGVNYCTDVPMVDVVEKNRDDMSFGRPLGEWP